jgi:hypothetical protein
MIELVAFTLFITLFFILIFKHIQLKIKLSSTTVELIKANIDKVIIAEKLSETKNKNKADPSSEAFLKFVSDSRDWAYTYIEDVQASLNKFIVDVEPEILYFDTYGDLMGAEPNYNSMKKISIAYKKLKDLLPKDEQ